MASFEEILDRPASEIKAPSALPVGSYHCLVDGPPTTGKSSVKQTEFMQFKFKILKALEDVDAAQAAEMQVAGKLVSQDYYVTAPYMLTEMLTEHLGIDAKNGSGKEKSLREIVAEAPGKQLIVKLRHDLSKDGKRVFHRVDSTAHV